MTAEARACPEFKAFSLWLQNPHRLISLGEIMKAVHLSSIYWAAEAIGATLREEENDPAFITRFDRAVYFADLRMFKAACESLGFDWTVNQIDRALLIIEEAKNDGNTVLWQRLKPALVQLRVRWHEQARDVNVYHLAPSDDELLNQPLVGWEVVVAKFPDMGDDIEESGKCLALGIWTASVFHVMRVAESGLYKVAKAVGAKYDRREWEVVLRDIDDALKAMMLSPGNVKMSTRKRANRKAKHDFYSEATAHLRNIKGCWRHKTAHVGQAYTQEKAEEIYRHTQALMIRLATPRGKQSR